MPDAPQTKYAVTVFWPEPRRVVTSFFTTDIRAVSFMGRATCAGATILECRAPRDRVAA